ncbi:MAG: hypothetical protein JSU82_08515 [Rhodospirillales bacterium]|nr:MAG: hypothetical protein JSU82_08515 [Rhodospirillales bacterium]
MSRIALMVVAGAMLAACSGGYEKIPSQSYDIDYDVFSVVGWSGNIDVFLIKTFESEGMVALCGGYTRGKTSFATIGNRRWADISEIYIDEVKIGNAEFMSQIPVSGFRQGDDPKDVFIALQEMTPSLPCVRSRVPWKEQYGSTKVERRGATQIVVED